MSTTAATTGQFIEINGANLYVEEYGAGDPLVLVHAGLCASPMWCASVPLLAEHYRVVTFDDRGHGRSSNPAGSLSYEAIADDTVSLIDALGLDKPFVGGWSDGGEVALQVGLRHPGVARALIAGGTSLELGAEETRAKMREFFHIDGAGNVDFDAFAAQFGDSIVPMMLQWQPAGLPQVRTVVEQSAAMWLAYAGLSQDQLNRIGEPALVIVGDRDEHVPVEEAVRLYRSLPNAELSILPGASHMRPIFDPTSLVRAMTDFMQRH